MCWLGTLYQFDKRGAPLSAWLLDTSQSHSLCHVDDKCAVGSQHSLGLVSAYFYQSMAFTSFSPFTLTAQFEVSSGQGISQDLETGCPKLGFVKKNWASYFSRKATVYSDSNHKLGLTNEIRHTILIQCHVNYTEVEKLSHFQKFLTKIFGWSERESVCERKERERQKERERELSSL